MENQIKIDKDVSVEQLLLKLMEVESTSGNEGNVANALADWLQLHGWKITKQADPANVNRFNLVATRKPLLDIRGDIAILMNSHLDTVPPYIEPTLAENGTVIKGRGSCDAKGQVAAMCFAVNSLDEDSKQKVALLFVYSEETDHKGAKDCNALQLQPKSAIIVGEPTQLKLATSQKGIVKVKLVSEGKAAHSGYPEMGVDALGKLLDVIQDLRAVSWPVDDKLGATTMNVGVLQGGQAANVVPAYAEAHILFRVVTGTEDVLNTLHQTVRERVRVHTVTVNEPLSLDTLDGFETAVVAFNTDIPYISVPASCKRFLYGAGSITDAHSQWEFVNVKDLHKAVEDYATMIEMILKADCDKA